MASSPLESPEIFRSRFTDRLKGRPAMPFASFMDLALYDPVCGYYTADRERVARRAGADFYTAESFRDVFSELVAAAAVKLLGDRDPAEFTFTEVGAEPGAGLNPASLERFAALRSIRLGEKQAGFPPRSIVFSNELYDAQPFHRLVYRNGRWTEAGVALREGQPAWVDLETLGRETSTILHQLPETAPEGAIMDLPLRAARLMKAQVDPDWEGLIIAADYGRSWIALCQDYPEGTGRAYRNHRQHGDLLAHPGQQDLTCHICWDWLAEVLEQNHFVSIKLESQEAFFMRHAPGAIEKIITEPGGGIGPRQSQLKTLLHPGLMGQKFQVLSAQRWRA